MKITPECWRPIYDPKEHYLDIFSHEELLRFEGLPGFTQALGEMGVLVDMMIPTPPEIEEFVHAGDVVIRHVGPSAHKGYVTLGFHRGRLIIP